MTNDGVLGSSHHPRRERRGQRRCNVRLSRDLGGCTDDAVLTESNRIPTYAFVQMTPNTLTEKEVPISRTRPKVPHPAGSICEWSADSARATGLRGLPRD